MVLSFREDQTPQILFMQHNLVVINNLVQDGEIVDLVALSTRMVQEKIVSV